MNERYRSFYKKTSKNFDIVQKGWLNLVKAYAKYADTIAARMESCEKNGIEVHGHSIDCANSNQKEYDALKAEISKFAKLCGIWCGTSAEDDMSRLISDFSENLYSLMEECENNGKL